MSDSNEYADIIRALRVMHGTILAETGEQFRDSVKETMPSKAADALEAVLAERDKLKATSDAHVKGWMHQCDKATAAIKERDALAKERDALLARLAPVVEEELVEIAADAISTYMPGKVQWGDAKDAAIDAIAAIRPHIEAAERERCARIAETPELWVTDKPTRGCDDIAAAIRSGK